MRANGSESHHDWSGGPLGRRVGLGTTLALAAVLGAMWAIPQGGAAPAPLPAHQRRVQWPDVTGTWIMHYYEGCHYTYHLSSDGRYKYRWGRPTDYEKWQISQWYGEHDPECRYMEWELCDGGSRLIMRQSYSVEVEHRCSFVRDSAGWRDEYGISVYLRRPGVMHLID